MQSDVQAVGWTDPVDDAWHPKPTSRGTSTKSRGTRPSATISITMRSRLRAAVVTTCGDLVKCKAMPEVVMRSEPSPVAYAAAGPEVTYECLLWLQRGRRT